MAKGLTPLMDAARRGNVEAAKAALGGASRKALVGRESEFEIALRFAVHSGNLALVRLLVKNKARVECGADSILKAPAVAGNEGMVRFLIEHGAHASTPHERLLMECCKAGRKAVAQLLVQHGADPNYRDGMLLVEAAEDGDARAMQILIDCGGDPNGARWELILMRAISGDCAETVRVLAEAGVDLIEHGAEALKVARRWCAEGAEQVIREQQSAQGEALRHHFARQLAPQGAGAVAWY